MSYKKFTEFLKGNNSCVPISLKKHNCVKLYNNGGKIQRRRQDFGSGCGTFYGDAGEF